MNFSASKGNTTNLPDIVITGGPRSNVGQAAGLVNLADAYGSLRKNSPQYGEIARQNYAQRSAERALNTELQGRFDAQQIANKYGIEAAKLQAKAQKDAASEESKGQMIGSTIGAVAQVAGAALMFSDEKTKENINPIEDALATLRNLKPVTFNYTEGYSMTPERMHHGFVAQEYKEVMPDATYYDEEYGVLCIDTNDLIGLLVRAIQQLETRVARMEAANALVGV